jgi:hypothetical protein
MNSGGVGEANFFPLLIDHAPNQSDVPTYLSGD